jgi:hypothetical protein
MPGEAGGTAGEDTTQSISPNEKTAPVVNGSNVETLPRGTGKQVFHLLISVAVISYIEVVKQAFLSG